MTICIELKMCPIYYSRMSNLEELSDQNETNKQFIKIIQNDLFFMLNKKMKTANVIDNYDICGDVFVPKSAEYKKQSYIVTSICSKSFKKLDTIRSISFPHDSKLQTIEKRAFSDSKIEIISIPQSLRELRKGWCARTRYLKIVNIDKNNSIYKNYEKNIVIGKSDTNNSEYDILLFVNRFSEKVVIPNFIKQIDAYSFQSSLIEEITIPENVTIICQNAFSDCKRLQRIEFSPNSKLEIIENDAFEFTRIKKLTIPSSLIKLDDCWCSNTNYLKHLSVDSDNQIYKKYDNNIVIGKSDKNNEEYDVLIFVDRYIEKVTIPPCIKKIASYAFANCSITEIVIPNSVTEIGEGSFMECNKLQKIEISPNESKLKTIGGKAFNSTLISNFTIPSNVVSIGEYCFEYSNKNIEYSPDSKLKVMNNFGFCNLENIIIPSNITEFKNKWFDYKLKNIKIDDKNRFIKFDENDKFIIGKNDLNKDEFDVIYYIKNNIKGSITIPSCIKQINSYSFANSLIEKVIISSQLKEINDYAFFGCFKLRQIEFLPNSKLTKIGKNAFSFTSIELIEIPPHVKKIDEETFFRCNNLKKVSFTLNSELEIIGKNAFSDSSIEYLFIPSSVTELKKGWCNNTVNLKNVELDVNNKYYKKYNEKMIIGKSSTESDEFDVLVFVERDAINITIPSFIKHISSQSFSYSLIQTISIPSQIKRIHREAFYSCKNLNKIEIPLNSQLTNIEPYSFSYTSIKEIQIPNGVINFFNYAFSLCEELKKIEFQNDSNLKMIGSSSFDDADIKCIKIPSSVEELKCDWCHGTHFEKVIVDKDNKNYKNFGNNIVIGKSDSKNSEYDVLVFASRDYYIEKIEIPPFIKKIDSFSFETTFIDEIILPSNVVEIGMCAFNYCFRLSKFKIEPNSNLKIINQEAFCHSPIKSFIIPPLVNFIGKYSFSDCKYLEIIELNEYSTLEFLSLNDFDNVIIMIPVK